LLAARRKNIQPPTVISRVSQKGGAAGGGHAEGLTITPSWPRRQRMGERAAVRGAGRDDGGLRHCPDGLPLCPFRHPQPLLQSSFAVFRRRLDPAWLALLSEAVALAVDTEAMGLVHGAIGLLPGQMPMPVSNVWLATPDCARQRLAPRLQAADGKIPAMRRCFHFARFDVAATGGRRWGLP